MAKRSHGAPPERRQVEEKSFVGARVESEKPNSWGMSADGVRDHVTTDGCLLGVPGKWRACGWSVGQLDHDEEVGAMHGMYGTLDAELEVQRTIKRA